MADICESAKTILTGNSGVEDCNCPTPTNLRVVGYADPVQGGTTYGTMYTCDPVEGATGYKYWRKAPDGEWEEVNSSIIQLPTTGGRNYSVAVSAICGEDCESPKLIIEPPPDPETKCWEPPNVSVSVEVIYDYPPLTSVSRDKENGYAACARLRWQVVPDAVSYNTYSSSDNGVTWVAQLGSIVGNSSEQHPLPWEVYLDWAVSVVYPDGGESEKCVATFSGKWFDWGDSW